MVSADDAWTGIWLFASDENNIREVYAFPKSWKAQDLMMNAPSIIDQEQLDELHIEIKEELE